MEPKSLKTSVVIIGAGFCGTMLAVNLIKMIPANSAFSFAIIEKSGNFAAGSAFATEDPNHLLNVPAIRMGALSGNPEHFIAWLKLHGYEFGNEDYVPRKIYRLYLQSLFGQALIEAKEKKIEVHCITGEATDINETDTSLKVILNNGFIETQSIVLATNVPQVKKMDVEDKMPSGVYVENIWNPPPDSIITHSSLANCDPNTRVVIIGSGLTMVDGVISLVKRKFPGEIVAISTHGKFPESHNKLGSPLAPFILPQNGMKLSELMRCFRKELKSGLNRGADWRAIFDSLRSVTVSIWQKLSIHDKKKFIRYLLPMWNRSRHRIPPHIYQLLVQLQKEGKFKLIASSVRKIQKDGKRLAVVTSNESIAADYVLNCTGAELDVRKWTNSLFQNMLKKGFIQSHALNMGLAVDEHYRVSSSSKLPIYALSQLLWGERFETVAVPELREQCAAVAKELMK